MFGDGLVIRRVGGQSEVNSEVNSSHSEVNLRSILSRTGTKLSKTGTKLSKTVIFLSKTQSNGRVKPSFLIKTVYNQSGTLNTAVF